jgi:ribosomal protein L7/L12
MRVSEQVMTTASKIDDVIRKYLSNSHKIDAIRFYRNVIHCPIKEAKEYVDSIERRMRDGRK